MTPNICKILLTSTFFYFSTHFMFTSANHLEISKDVQFTATNLPDKSWAFYTVQKRNNVLIASKGNTLLRFTLDSSKRITDCSAHQYSNAQEGRLLRKSKIFDLQSRFIQRHFPNLIKKSFREMRQICQQFEARLNRKRRSASRWAMFPGTKWCGAGNTAANESDYGADINTDKCCHAHDRCTDSIISFDTKYGYTNKTPFTISNCDCDDDFHACLQIVGTDSAANVGRLFFNYLKMKCFTKEEAHVCIDWKYNMWCQERGWVIQATVHDALPWN